MKKNGHDFAIYTHENLNVIYETYQNFSKYLYLEDSKFNERLIKILRVRPKDTVIAFNKTYNIKLEIQKVLKNKVLFSIIKFSKNKPILPKINWIVPILEKKAFEEVVSILTVLGADKIFPVLTKKVSRKKFSQGEALRFERLMISAAEQSKQFVFPKIEPLMQLDNLIKEITNKYKNSQKIFFDPKGLSCRDFLKNLQKAFPRKIICMVGPSGDLTLEEKFLLKENDFHFISLTKSVLRSELAITIATGILRAFIL